jgi:hypothetical protein
VSIRRKKKKATGENFRSADVNEKEKDAYINKKKKSFDHIYRTMRIYNLIGERKNIVDMSIHATILVVIFISLASYLCSLLCCSICSHVYQI